MLAAIQAPVIMMSQNRQEDRDRLHAQNDYEVNLKAEIEIEQLHQKLDDLRERQWEELIAIQNRQIDLLESSWRCCKGSQVRGIRRVAPRLRHLWRSARGVCQRQHFARKRLR